jgi:hypothetical protein
MKTQLPLVRLPGCAHFFALLLFTAFGLVQSAQAQSKAGRVLDSKAHHLGNTDVTALNWTETTAKPEGTSLELPFTAEANAAETVLAITQRDVSRPWRLVVNGKRIATLKRNTDPQVFYYAVPAGALLDGNNALVVEAGEGDDIVVGPITLHNQTLAEVLDLQPVAISVREARSGQPVPARVTITDLQNELVEIFNAFTNETAVRKGLLYTRGTETWIKLPRGEYFVYATRGMEWSRGQTRISVRKDRVARADLRIEREVDTTGFVATDTHIHTVTFSGHGDASIEERMLTLAGEGVELAVATDHNHNIDYRSTQKKMLVTDYFTAVTGNEVTTAIGHMNAFPLDPKAEPPAWKLESWVQLVDGIRAKGAKVVILNHPRWPNLATSIFTKFGLNRVSGDFRSGTTLPFDAVEVANALTPQPDPLYIFQDWFALLNRGYKVAGVASSDSHTVGEPVGQGRSYVPSDTDDPTKINVDDACNRFLRGQTTFSLGICADMVVNGRFKMGDLVPAKTGVVHVRFRVAAASWVTPRRALVFINGHQVAEKPVRSLAPRRPTNEFIDFVINVPKHDAHLICVVLGEGVSHPSWLASEKFTLAATNPVFLDADGDGKYSSPRELALARLKQAGISTDHQWEALAEADDVIAIQMLSLMREHWPESEQKTLETRIREAAASRPLFRDYIEYPLPPIRLSAGQLK